METNIIDKTYNEAIKGLNNEILEDCDRWYNYVLNLPKNQQVIYTVLLLNWQVENGGFHQYFFNSYGQFSYLTIKNLIIIKANQRADLLDSATHLVNEDYLIEDNFRHLIFNRRLSKIVDFDDKLFKKLNDLDNKYYNLDEDLEQLLVDYLTNHLKS